MRGQRRALRRPSAGACGALETRRSFRDRRRSGRSEPRRRYHSHETALRTAQDRNPAAKPRIHPSFLRPVLSTMVLRGRSVHSVGRNAALVALTHSPHCPGTSANCAEPEGRCRHKAVIRIATVTPQLGGVRTYTVHREGLECAPSRRSFASAKSTSPPICDIALS